MNPMEFTLALLALVFVYKIIVSTIRRRDRARNDDDARTLQELHKITTRLEERVEALETIVIDRTRESDFDRKLYS